MMNIPLNAIPNQALSISLDNNQWEIEVKTVNGAIAFSLSLNGVSVIDGQRAVAGALIIPAQYQESGNFTLLCQSFAVPDYTQFGITQFLTYLSAVDLAAIRARGTPPITQAFFNPIAPLPLRFSPQGYELAVQPIVAQNVVEIYVAAPLV